MATLLTCGCRTSGPKARTVATMNIEPMFSSDGHQFTTALMATYAQLPPQKVYALTYYSQFPDLDSRFSAVWVGLWTAPLPCCWRWRGDIMAQLHSLHGGNNAEVQFRRWYLAELVRRKVREGTEESLMEAGLMIHALGDSYAHTKGEFKGGAETAFGSLVGHAFYWHEPDEIARPEVFPKYAEYATQLFKAVGGADADLPRVQAYTNALSRLVWKPGQESFKTAKKRMVAEIETISGNAPGWSWQEYNDFIRRSKPLTPAQVQKVMDEINRGP